MKKWEFSRAWQGLKPFNLKFLCLCVFLTGCASEPLVDLTPPQVPPDKTVVTVNGESLSLEEFDNEFRLMQIHYSAVSEGDMRTIKLRLFEQVVNRRILVQEARRTGLRLTQREADEALRGALKEMPEDFLQILKVQGVSEGAWKRKLLQENFARKLIDREVNAKVKISPEEGEEYYWSHLRDYWLPEAVRVLHLVVRKKADFEKVLAALQKGEEFQKVAGTYSAGVEKTEGGDWGLMDLDRMSPAYREVLERLNPGEISKPLKDDFGYHLFRLEKKLPRRMQPFNEAMGKILENLLKEEQDLRFDQWMGELKKKSTIRVNQDMAPLVGVNLEALREE